MVAALTPPPLKGPTAKEKKYDRQLRLWAASGQQALEDAHILLINSGSGTVGVETLKNLVLPGIGTITIVDDAMVSEQDLGVNFFLETGSLGKSRAAECCRLLRELNPEVQGNAIPQSPAKFVAESDLSRYTLILIVAPTQLAGVLEPVSKAAAKHSIPLFYIHCAGFYSHFSIQLPDYFPIVETHPDPVSTQDLRLLKPWPELTEYMKSKTQRLDTMSDHEHGHVPYLLLLLHYLEKWKAEHDGKYPSNYKEKTEFRKSVEVGERKSNPEGGEENFGEASAAVLKSLNAPIVPSGLRKIFNEPECIAPTTSSLSFFIIAHALNAFVATTGALPLPGAVPDMKAQSADYITLQNVYRAKSQADITAITFTIRAIEEKLQRPTPVDAKEIEAFCKGASFVKLLRGRPLAIPVVSEPKVEAGRQITFDWRGRENMLGRELGDESSLMALYVALLAFNVVVEAYDASASPEKLLSTIDQQAVQADLRAQAKSIAADVLEDKVEVAADVAERLDKICDEILRTGGVEMHNIAALTGGMVAQEVIKVVTKQYVPVNNTCVFDGIQSKTGVFRV